MKALQTFDIYPHPLEDSRHQLYNTVTGRIATTDVNVADWIVIGDKMKDKFTPCDLHNF